MTRHIRLACFALVSAPITVWAHEGESLAPHDLWSAWSFEPWVVLLLALSASAFVVGTAKLRTSAGRWPVGIALSAASFVTGWVVLAISLVSPIHVLGSALFSAHMAQHELLMVVAAPLLVAARPIVPALWSLPQSGRLGAGALFRSSAVSRVWGFVSRPIVAFALHGAAIWIWHMPRLYGSTIASDALHTLQHASFLSTALVFWWTVLPASRAGRNGTAIFSLFATALHTSVLGALLAFSNASWYPAYHATTGPWGLSPLDDQQLGGLIMWIPGGLTYLVVALMGISRLLRDSDVSAASHPTRLRITSAAMLGLFFLVGCRQGSSRNTQLIAGSDHERGQQIMGAYGCPTCHVIPGVRGATGKVGPPLTGVADRVYLAGRVANEPQNMIDWIRNPQKIDPQTAMPNTGVTERDARDIAAYLYTLK
jgi:putative membrane protein